MSELGLHMEVEPPRRPDPEKRGRGPLIAALVIMTMLLLRLNLKQNVQMSTNKLMSLKKLT